MDPCHGQGMQRLLHAKDHRPLLMLVAVTAELVDQPGGWNIQIAGVMGDHDFVKASTNEGGVRSLWMHDSRNKAGAIDAETQSAAGRGTWNAEVVVGDVNRARCRGGG